MIKSWMESLLIALSMYSALPVKCLNWTEKNLRNAMVFFPLVGLLCGVGLFVVWTFCELLHVGAVLFGVLAVLSGILITGGIHLDGFADTSDALSSYGDREKKLAILKDPHCGAFAVIRLCGYFVLYFALCACLRFTLRVGAVWTLALVLERALSGYAVATFPMAKNTGLAHTFATAADKRRVQIVLLAVSVCVGAGMALLGGGLLALAALAVLWRYRAVAAKQFGGITGDLAGWFLQRAELVMLAALLISEGWIG